MAVLYVGEYTALATRVSEAPFVQAPPVAEQTVAIGAGSVQSSAFNAATRIIRVHTDAICSILIGANPTATATKGRMAAGSTEYFGVTPGDKIAVITNT